MNRMFFLVFLSTFLAACGGGGSSSSSSVPPRPAVNDDYGVTTVNEATQIDVLRNDRPRGGGALSVTPDATSTMDGTIETDPESGRLVYTPATDFTGTDTFTYEASNNNGSNTATVSVVVEAGDLAGACNTDIAAKRDAGQRYCIDAAFESFDGTRIAIQLFIPNSEARRLNAVTSGAGTVTADNAFSPLLVHAHGFGGRKTNEFDPAEPSVQVDKQVALDAWRAGYWVISYTQRGFGGENGDNGADIRELASGGQIGLMSAGKEGLDFVSLVNWAMCYLRSEFDPTTVDYDESGSYSDMPVPGDLTEFNDICGALGSSLLVSDNGEALSGFTDDPAIGMIGYSYGGGAQIIAQSVDQRVDAIIPMTTWYDLRYSLHPNDAPKTTWIEIMTAFATRGKNSEPLPDLIVQGNAEANGANESTDDNPHNKQRQVSVGIMNQLAPNGGVGFCDGNPSYYASKYSDPDGEATDFINDGVPLPFGAVTTRAARADALFIQGHSDTLFNFNEGYDNARCFANSSENPDVRFISQHSGHPIPAPAGPPHYAQQDSDLYIDEVIHCGTDQDGQPQRYNMREVGMAWLDAKLRDTVDFDQVFPHRTCITQANTNPNVVFTPDDPYYLAVTSGTNATDAGYLFPREGVAGDSLNDILLGGTATTVPETTLTTGPATEPNGATFAPLFTVQNSRVLAGIPLAQLQLTRDNLSNDEIVFAGIGVRREGELETLQFQTTALRLFPAPASLTGLPPAQASFSALDPRNFPFDLEKGHFYQIIWGDTLSAGRLPGVTARLLPGDEVGLVLFAQHPVFTSLSSPLAGQVTVTGTVFLPLHAPSPLPSEESRPDYLIDKP